MKTVICLLTLIWLTGCAHSGYSPSYIISDATKEVSAPEADGKEL